MAETRRMAPAPTVAQVRDYVLTMLEGLSSLAETVDDLQTRDRVRDLADHLMMSWTPRAATLLRQVAVEAEGPDTPAGALGDPPRGGLNAWRQP